MLGQMYNYRTISLHGWYPGQIIAGKLSTIPYKGFFKVLVEPSADERTIAEADVIKQIIQDNLHEGNAHTRFWYIKADGSITLVGKATHAPRNPETDVPNIPSKILLILTPQSRNMFDETSKMDQNIQIDSELINNNYINHFFSYPDQSWNLRN